jgi:hypothetical protein
MVAVYACGGLILYVARKFIGKDLLEIVVANVLVACFFGRDLPDTVGKHPFGGQGKGKRCTVHVDQNAVVQWAGRFLGVSFGIMDEIDGLSHGS